jgi:hypothetical protein
LIEPGSIIFLICEICPDDDTGLADMQASESRTLGLTPSWLRGWTAASRAYRFWHHLFFTESFFFVFVNYCSCRSFFSNCQIESLMQPSIALFAVRKQQAVMLLALIWVPPTHVSQSWKGR